MKTRPALVAALMILGLTTVCGAAPAGTVHTSKTQFRIPYRYDAAEMQELGAQEIQLYVSTDHGERWELRQRVSPEQGRFDYQALQDGEYWFTVKTLDVQGQLHPEGARSIPGLKVIVDTIPPGLSISLRQAANGKVQLGWSAADPNLDATSLRLEFFQPGANDWQPVSIAPRASGQTSWSVPEEGSVSVRGIVSDLAGNVGRSDSQVRIVPIVEQRNEPSAPDFSEPIARNGSPTGSGYVPAVPPPAPEINPFVPDPLSPFASRGSPRSAHNRRGPSFGQRNDRLISDSPHRRPDIVRRDPAPAETDEYPVNRHPGRQRIVNSLEFEIDYRVEDVGPSGVGSVELYITQNDGRKWYLYGSDSDRTSPFEVKVPRDGVYGFAIRVHSGVGLAVAPPQPDDEPDVYVVVDKTPPVARVFPAQQGKGDLLDRIVVRWEVTDDNLAEMPIALEYSSTPGGPWEPVSGWLQNTGTYAWSVRSGVPSKLYLRLTARDAAGNLTRAESQQPIFVDLSKPSARIVDVESASHR